MALKINEACINCDVCEPECPNQAIYPGEFIYEIDASLCTECVGHFDTPQCQIFCPVACIDVDLDRPESKSELYAKYEKIIATDMHA